jgi:hypothetical protein
MTEPMDLTPESARITQKSWLSSQSEVDANVHRRSVSVGDPDPGLHDRYLYWRQLRDMKGSADVESMGAASLEFYAHLCGWTLARAHARSGDPIAIAGYLGKSDAFDLSITDFSERYADQNGRDYQAFAEAVSSGRLEAIAGV